MKRKLPTLRQALRTAREDFRDRDYIKGYSEYPYDGGVLIVSQARDGQGGRLNGCFVARDARGEGKTYKIR